MNLNFPRPMKMIHRQLLQPATVLRRTGGVLGVLALLGLGAAPLRAHSGHSAWGPWSFDWEVKDDAGLGLRNVYYNSEKVLYKANMPVIRVKYDGDACGPYADRLNWDNLLDISNCGYKKVCQRSYTSGGRQWLELGILAAIGKYRLYQVYYFSQDGYLVVRCWSKGFHCNITHQHHAYWRLDFDLKDASADQVFVFDNNRPNEGWGPGWHKYVQEVDTLRNPPTNRQWFVRDNPTGHGMWILPGPNDTTADGFSVLDLGGRLYRFGEDAPWTGGSTGELGYNNGENIAEKDDVVWYVAHLHHVYPGDPNHWGYMGPTLKVSR